MSTSSSSSSTGTAVQLIRADELQEAGRKFLQMHDRHDSPFNIVTVSGAQRTGKSFLLNFIMGRERGFRVENLGACTQGVDIYSELLDVAEPTGFGRWFQGQPELAAARQFPVALIDLEGTGDKGKQYDAKVMVASYLVSQVIIFNANGQLGKAELLDQLGAIAILGRMVKGSFQEGRLFGHLHIVFRNWQHAGLNEVDIMKYIMGQEQLSRNLTDDEVTAINNRNYIRNIITECFASINVHCLPYPATPKVVEGHQALPFDLLEFGFVQKVKEVMISILPHLAETRSIQGQKLTPFLAVDILGSVLKQLRSGDEIKIESVVQSLQASIVRKTTDEAIEVLREKIEQAPVSVELDVKAVIDLAMKTLDKLKTFKLEDSVVEEARKKITEASEAMVLAWKTKRTEDDQVVCTKALGAGIEFLETEFECLSLDNELDYDSLMERTKGIYEMSKDRPVSKPVDDEFMGKLRQVGKQLRVDWMQRKQEKVRTEEEERKKAEWSAASDQLLKVNEHMIRSTNHLLEQRDEFESKINQLQTELDEERRKYIVQMKKAQNSFLEFILREHPKKSCKQAVVTALQSNDPDTKWQILEKIFVDQTKGKRWRKRFA